jgi:hypothetical protein
MAILDDFTINTTLKTIRHTSGVTVYSVNALYSAVKDFEDNAGNMDDEVIMTASTATEYELPNGYFMDYPSTNFLNGGAITTTGYTAEIQRVVTTDAGTNPVPSDIGLNVVATGGSGPLLHYDLDENDAGDSVNVWYVRTGSATALSGTIEVTTAGGTGTQTVSTSNDGEEVFTNVYSFGTITATVAPQFYIEQVLAGGDHRLIEWVANSNFSRGNMDVLVRTQVEGATSGLDNLLITIRQPGTTYDSSEQTLNGQRNPFALNAADDPDNLLSEWYFLFDGEAGTDIAVGDTLTADAKAWYCEVVEVGYFTDTATGYVGVRGLNESRDAVADNDAFTSSGTGTAVVNGTPGDRIVGYDAESVAMTTIGQIVTGGTSLAKSRLVGIDDNGTNGYLCLANDINNGGTIDYAEDSTYYDLYVNDETVTGSTEGSLTLDLTGGASPLNLQLAIAGMTGKVDYVFQHGSLGVAGGHSLAVGMHVTQAVSGATGVVTRVDGNTIYLGNTSIDFDNTNAINDDDSAGTGTPNSTPAWSDSHTVLRNFTQATARPYDLIVFLNGETVQRGYDFSKFRTGDGSTYQFNKYNLDTAALVRTPVNGQFYLSAYFDVDTPTNTYDKIGKRSAPIGNFAGGKWFCARGVWLEDVAGADSNALQLIDSDGVVRDPPIQVTISQTVTASGDRVFVVEDNGSGLTSKTTYNSHASNNTAGSTTFEVDGTPVIRTDTPTVPILRVVDDSSTSATMKEHRYRCASWTGNIYTLATASTGTVTVANAAGTTLIDSSATFVTDGVEQGDMIRLTTDGAISQVESVDSEIQLTTKIPEGGAENDYDAADAYEINTLAVSYVAADTAYTPYIDEIATGATTSVTVIFETNRNLLGKARQKGVIFAFTGSGSLTNTGATIATVRTPDLIAT